MTIGIGSQNPVKIAAVEEAVDIVHERLGLYGPVKFHALDVPSGVGAQPMSDAETQQGARQRAQAVLQAELHPDVAVGLEGGVEERPEGLFSTVWVVIRDREERLVEVNGARFRLPEEIAEPILAGEEMGVVMDRLTGKTNIKHQEGMIGTLTGGAVTRQEEYQNLVQLAYGLYRQQLGLELPQHQETGLPFPQA